jgi:exosortase
VNSSPAPSLADRAAVPAVVAALWLQLFAAASYGWLHGEYYAYGWYVPPLMAWFFLRHWRTCVAASRPGIMAAAVLSTGLVLVLAALRVIERVDMRWTMPLWIHAAVVTTVTHWLVARAAGGSLSRSLAPVTAFGLSAIPLPSSIEQVLVRSLTDGVLHVSALLFNLAGRPVQVVGDRLQSLGEVVQVTDGCSGIRSLQSFLMAALFFGEWMNLTVGRRCLMLGVAAAAALLVNVGRTITLAWFRFEHGKTGFQQTHDWVGFAAFLAGAAVMLAVSARLGEPRQTNRRTVRRTIKPAGESS